MEFLITGGVGLIARYTIKELLKRGDNVACIILPEQQELAKKLYGEDVKVAFSDAFDNEEIAKSLITNRIVIHTAFTRSNDGESIAQSLDFTYKVFSLCKRLGAKKVINISTRSVYKEPLRGELNTESSPIQCSSLIATAKYSTELLCRAFFLDDASIEFTNVRLSSVNELKLDNNMTRPLNVFVDKILKGEDIVVIDGSQVMSFIDPRDVAVAIALVAHSDKKYKEVYNVGTGHKCTMPLIEMAKKCIEIGKKRGHTSSKITIENKPINQNAGLDCSLIREDFGFESLIDIDSMIESLFELKQ